MRTIVFGDDRSAGADLAWLWINDQVWPGWQVDVVTIPETELGPPHVFGSVETVEWQPSDPRRVVPAAGLADVRHLTATADPRVVLGGRTDADLLVVGATGRGFLKRWLHLGSTTEWLLHSPPTTTVVARSGRAVHRVLVGVDGSVPARRALDAFVSLPWAGDTEVVVVGVDDGWVRPQPAVADASALLAGAGIEHRVDMPRGRATDVLMECIRAHRPDLVVLGARGTSRLRRVVAGSTASSVVRSADVSVLIGTVDDARAGTAAVREGGGPDTEQEDV